MSVTLPVPGPQMVIFKGIFDFDELYKVLSDWFVFRGYHFHETKYKHKAGRQEGYTREITWSAWKKVTDFMMYWFNIYILVEDAYDIEAAKDSSKKKLIKARLYVRVTAKLELDYNDRFEGSRFKQQMRHFLLSYVFKKKIDSYWADILQFKQYDVLNIIKETLDMQIKGNEHADVW